MVHWYLVHHAYATPEKEFLMEVPGLYQMLRKGELGQGRIAFIDHRLHKFSSAVTFELLISH